VADGAETAIALRRARRRGLLIVVLGIGLGGATFGWIAGWAGATPVAQWEGGALVGPGAFRNAPRDGAPGARESLVLRSDNRGQVLFGRYCDSCHTAGGGGFGTSLRSAQFKRQFASPESVAAVVRKGGFDMPSFPTSLVSEADLKDIAAYVVSLPEGK
jgi:hypothetical protein